jgi:toxin ParE1/3/4
MKLVVLPLADADIDAAGRWYEHEKDGLGEEFLRDVERILLFIGANPMAFAIEHGRLRGALLSKFPYVVRDRIRSETIEIVAVTHTSRSGSAWRGR